MDYTKNQELLEKAVLGDEKATQTLERAKEVELLAKEKIAALEAEYTQKCEAFKSECEQKVACAVSLVNFYEEAVFNILEKIPNVKVQEELKGFKGIYKEKKEQITETIGVIYQDYDLALERSKEEVRHEYEEKVAYLENEIAKINLYFSEVKGGNANGERKETEDSNPTQAQV